MRRRSARRCFERAHCDAVALALALALATSGSASAHCFAVWRYPRAQRCGITRPPVARIAQRAAAPVLRVLEPSPGPSFGATVDSAKSFDLPMIDADPAKTALRAQLWTLSYGLMNTGGR